MFLTNVAEFFIAEPKRFCNINRLLYKLVKSKLNMGKSEPAFTFIKTELVINVQRRVNKGSDVPVLVKFLKHRHLLSVLHFTVILLNIRAQFLFD